MDEVRCATHNTVVECEVEEFEPSDPTGGPAASWECLCPVGGTTCDDSWFQAKVD